MIHAATMLALVWYSLDVAAVAPVEFSQNSELFLIVHNGLLCIIYFSSSVHELWIRIQRLWNSHCIDQRRFLITFLTIIIIFLFMPHAFIECKWTGKYQQSKLFLLCDRLVRLSREHSSQFSLLYLNNGHSTFDLDERQRQLSLSVIS